MKRSIRETARKSAPFYFFRRPAVFKRASIFVRVFRGFFCRRTVGVNEHQLAPSVSGNVALLHVPLALADGEHGICGFGAVAETRDVTVAVLSYCPDIDTLCAMAVLFVVAFHIEKNWLPGGFLGVDIFFVISGFLITMIIHREMSQRIFSFKTFYKAVAFLLV